MSNDTRNYYERELDLIDFAGPHPAKMLIGSEGKTTKTLDINRESAAALVSKLCAVFFIDLTLANTMKAAPEKRTPIFSPCYTMGLSRDINGNEILKIRGMGGSGKGFSIQTCGNLPITHAQGLTPESWAEVGDYVARYGTKRQRAIVGL